MADTGLINNDGVVQLVDVTGFPTDPSGLLAGAVWNNGGTIAVVPGAVPDPNAARLFLTNLSASQLLLHGGGDLPTDPTSLLPDQVWNNGGLICVGSGARAGAGPEAPIYADVARRKWLEWAAKRKKRVVTLPAKKVTLPAETRPSAPVPVPEKVTLPSLPDQLLAANLRAVSIQPEPTDGALATVAALREAMLRAREQDEDDIEMLLLSE